MGALLEVGGLSLFLDQSVDLLDIYVDGLIVTNFL